MTTPKDIEAGQIPQIAEIMEQARIYASAYSLIGGRFDFGEAKENAEVEHDHLIDLITRPIQAERQSFYARDALLIEALRLHQMIFDSFRGYIPDFEESVVILLRKAKEMPLPAPPSPPTAEQEAE